MFSGKPESPLNRLTSEGGVGVLGAASGSSSSSFSYTWQGAAAAILSTLQTKAIAHDCLPTLLTLDNQKVSFTNGTQISVQTQSTVATTTTTATNSYQYINTGLTINITPRVSGDNVFLEIQQQNSNAQPRNDGNPNPDIIQNSQQTTVMVANGDTMLLGGLFQDNSSFGSSAYLSFRLFQSSADCLETRAGSQADPSW
jgi:general secretion pathway protein D